MVRITDQDRAEAQAVMDKFGVTSMTVDELAGIRAYSALINRVEEYAMNGVGYDELTEEQKETIACAVNGGLELILAEVESIIHGE